MFTTKTLLASTLLCLLTSAGAVSAQSLPPKDAPVSDAPTDEAIFKACEKTALDLRLERAVHEQTKEKLRAKDDIIAIKDEQIAGLRSIIADLRAAIELRTAADAKAMEMVRLAEARVATLEAENARLKGQRKWLVVIGAVGGALATGAAGRN